MNERQDITIAGNFLLGLANRLTFLDQQIFKAFVCSTYAFDSIGGIC